MYFIIEWREKIQGDEDNIPYLSEAAGLLFSGTNNILTIFDMHDFLFRFFLSHISTIHESEK